MSRIELKNIDWNLLWQDAVKKKTKKPSNAAGWDSRAASFNKRNAQSPYNKHFIKLLQPKKEWTILDVGCGPGTLTIPLAKQVQQVSALDFSPKMLEIIQQRAKKAGLRNITTYNLSWTDDWKAHGVKPHDVTLASRSLGVEDLQAALEKLTRFAQETIAITDRVGHGPMDPDAFKAVGRDMDSGPDYIYTVNLLYQMGIRATVDFIHLEDTITYLSLDEAINNYKWMLPNLTDEENRRLKKYVQSISSVQTDGKIILHRKHPPTWAYICWHP